MPLANTKIGSLNDILSSRSRATFRYRVNFNKVLKSNLEEMKRWCEDNCESLWRSEQFYAIYWQFDSEKDATMFMLRWGTAEGNELR